MSPETTEVTAAVAAWGGADRPPRLISERENAIYEVWPGGRRAALRLHRAGYQDAAAIRSELHWMQALATVGAPVPAPIPTTAGALLHQVPGARAASMVSWAPGHPLGAAHQPLSGTPTEHAARFRMIGRVIARLHDATDAMSLPEGFTRPAWDEEGLLGDFPFWGCFWENPTLASGEAAQLLEARKKARAVLAAYRARGADYGLIHADLMRENLLLDGDTVTIIDFDDSGFGFRLYDLGTLLIQNLDEPDFPALQAAAIEGYSRVRPLTDEDAALVPMFTMLRCLASCGWAVPRLPEGSPGLRRYATRAISEARAFLERPLPFSV